VLRPSFVAARHEDSVVARAGEDQVAAALGDAGDHVEVVA